MSALTPWSRAASSNSEHGHQSALFMWANMAALFGYEAANKPMSYTTDGFARHHYGPVALDAERRIIGGPAAVRELQWLHAIKNQGHGDKIRGNISKAEGVKAGVPDLFLPVARAMLNVPGHWNGETFHGFYIELKRPVSARGSKGTERPDQERWLTYLKEAGYACGVYVGWEAARDALISYLAGEFVFPA